MSFRPERSGEKGFLRTTADYAGGSDSGLSLCLACAAQRCTTALRTACGLWLTVNRSDVSGAASDRGCELQAESCRLSPSSRPARNSVVPGTHRSALIACRLAFPLSLICLRSSLIAQHSPLIALQMCPSCHTAPGHRGSKAPFGRVCGPNLRPCGRGLRLLPHACLEYCPCCRGAEPIPRCPRQAPPSADQSRHR